MSGTRVELLLVLTGTLLVLGREGWREVKNHEITRLYPDADLHFQPGLTGESWVDEDEEDKLISEYDTDDDDLIDFNHEVEKPPNPTRTWSTPASTKLEYKCTDNGFIITLPDALFDEDSVVNWFPDFDFPLDCNYDLAQNHLTIPFAEECNVTKSINGYNLTWWHTDDDGKKQTDNIFCKRGAVGGPAVGPRTGEQPVPRPKCSDPVISAHSPGIHPPARSCDFPSVEWIPCGYPGILPSECRALGCCVSPTSSCYSPMDECTSDGYFVFRISHDSASVPVDPRNLIIPGTNCKPVFVSNKVAVFKFKVTECGVHTYSIGETRIYLAEVQTVIRAWNLKYGVIARSDPLRFLIECRYSQSDQHSSASVGYMVKTPSTDPPSPIRYNGLYCVELRIAKDETYSSFYTNHHLPLQRLLGQPVYLELRLRSPKPEAVVLVNYCVAYPRFANNALVLVYEGCTNAHDPHVFILLVDDLPKNRHTRRLMVKAFQFMHQKTNKYLEEEIYFMCSTEVCFPSEQNCEERCFDGAPRR